MVMDYRASIVSCVDIECLIRYYVNLFLFYFFLFVCWFFFFFFFFFSSRRRHTRLTCDWSSDVCSSDLARSDGDAGPAQHRAGLPICPLVARRAAQEGRRLGAAVRPDRAPQGLAGARSEERRVGKECRCRWSP